MNVENMVARQEINGKDVQIYTLPASEGWVIGTQLLKVVLPVVGGLADEIFSDEETSKGQVPKTFSEMAQRILTQLDNFDTLKLVQRLLKDASVNGQKIDFDQYYRKNYGELFLHLEFTLKENFSSFFEGTGLKTRFFSALGAMTGDQAESDEQ